MAIIGIRVSSHLPERSLSDHLQTFCGTLPPKFVNDIFANWNDYIQKKIAKPQLSQNKLKKHIDDVSVFLSQPWMSRYKSFKNDINMLVKACKNVSDWIEKKNIQQNVRHKRTVVEPKYPDIRFIKQSATVLFNYFWKEIDSLFTEYQAAVHERRHYNVLYLPFAIGVRELIDKVKRRKPDIRTPSEEWV